MLETFNFRVILEYMPLYFKCFSATLWLSGAGLVGALLLGTVACAMRLSQSRIVSLIAGVYIESIRSTPLLAQIYFFYFGLPSLGIMFSEEVTGVFALTLNSGAYMAEIIRAGIQSIPHGQIEAGIASGLNYFQRMRYIILPQALPGIITGVILGLLRAGGETAPILFTVAAFFLPSLPQSPFDQTMALPYHLYVISTQVPGMPLEVQYGTALVLLALVLSMNVVATLIRSYFRRRRPW